MAAAVAQYRHWQAGKFIVCQSPSNEDLLRMLDRQMHTSMQAMCVAVAIDH